LSPPESKFIIYVIFTNSYGSAFSKSNIFWGGSYGNSIRKAFKRLLSQGEIPLLVLAAYGVCGPFYIFWNLSECLSHRVIGCGFSKCRSRLGIPFCRAPELCYLRGVGVLLP
jgi:hypothetical protein